MSSHCLFQDLTPIELSSADQAQAPILDKAKNI